MRLVLTNQSGLFKSKVVRQTTLKLVHDIGCGWVYVVPMFATLITADDANTTHAVVVVCWLPCLLPTPTKQRGLFLSVVCVFQVAHVGN